MKIVVIGASGNVGSRVVRFAAQTGHEVVAIARRVEAVPAAPGVRVVQASAEEVDALADASHGADVLFVAITGSVRDGAFMQTRLPGILAAAGKAKVGRVVLTSVFGAGDTANKASWYARLVYRTLLGRFLGDKVASDQILQQSGQDWTIVYPVNLKDAKASGQFAAVPLKFVKRVPGMPALPMDDAAHAILSVIEDTSSRGQRVLITSATGWIAAT